MSAQQAETCRAHTGRATAPRTPVREAWVVAGRRAGESRVAALVAVYLAAFGDHRRILAVHDLRQSGVKHLIHAGNDPHTVMA